MSVGGCYTDFHVDFGGTSVWYHVMKGRKVSVKKKCVLYLTDFRFLRCLHFHYSLTYGVIKHKW